MCLILSRRTSCYRATVQAFSPDDEKALEAAQEKFEFQAEVSR